jgi:hypothetical protein
MTCGPVPVHSLGGVLGEGHIPHLVQAVLDRPVPPEEVGKPGRAGWAKARLGIA